MNAALTEPWYMAFDWETHLIGPDLCQCGECHDTLPPPVCMSWAMPGDRSDVVAPAEGLEILEECLRDPLCHIIGAETAFDVLISVRANADPEECEGWMAAWVAAYEAGRVHDVLVRQKCLDLAVGSFKFHTHSDGRVTRVGRSLSDATNDALGYRLSKPDLETKATHPRLRYAELDGVPLDQWSAIAEDEGWADDPIEYARQDAVATLDIFFAQENWQTHRRWSRIIDLWMGRSVLPQGDLANPLADAHAQNCHALWLKQMSAEGIYTDEDALDQYETRVLADYTSLCVSCRDFGLLRRAYWRDQKGLKRIGSEYSGRIAWAELKVALDVDDPEAHAVWDELKEQGFVRWRHVKNEAAARRRMYDVFTMAGQVAPRTKTYEREMKLVAQGLRAEPRDDEYIALDADACRLGGLLEIELDLEQPMLQDYAHLVHASNVINTHIPKLRCGVDTPLHTHFNSLVETGRTSSSDPPIQNRERGEKEFAGDRECFVPPPPDETTGEEYVFIDIDYPQLELFAHAQNCRWWLGYSPLGDSLNRGEDPHTAFAARIIGSELGRDVSYAEAESMYETGTIKGQRDAAKGTNFGRLGALGARTMVSYAARAYKVVLPEARWKWLLELWDEQWPEMPEYRELVSSWETYEGSNEYLVANCYSGRLRAGCKYTVACNSPFQGLGADVAKLAGWYIFKACYVRGVDDALFGCRPMNFIHDQFLIACLLPRANDAAKRVEYWCQLAARELLPDYGEAMAKKTKALLTHRWSKQAKRLVDKAGNLEAWEDARLFSGSAA